MQFISDINILRWFRFEKQLSDRTEVNIFCDASSEAYGVTSYVNYFSECPKKHISSFLLLKSHFAPIKEKHPDNISLRTASCCVSNLSLKHYLKKNRLPHR